MPKIIGIYIALLGAILAFCTNIPIKKIVEKGRIRGGVYSIRSPNESELEIKFNGKEEQQVHFSLMKRRTYEKSGTGDFEINNKIAANSNHIHKLESDSIYQINISTHTETSNLRIKDLDIRYKRTEYYKLSERCFQFSLTVISIGFIIYYSS